MRLITKTSFTREAVRVGLAKVFRVRPEMIILAADLPEICGWVENVAAPRKTGRYRGKKSGIEQTRLELLSGSHD